MGRAIDKQTMLGLIIDAKRTDPETGSFAEWLVFVVVWGVGQPPQGAADLRGMRL